MSADREKAEEWASRIKYSNSFPLEDCDLAEAHLAGQECGEQRAVEGICKRLRYWQKELNVAFDYAADIESGAWREKP